MVLFALVAVSMASFIGSTGYDYSSPYTSYGGGYSRPYAGYGLGGYNQGTYLSQELFSFDFSNVIFFIIDHV